MNLFNILKHLKKDCRIYVNHRVKHVTNNINEVKKGSIFFVYKGKSYNGYEYIKNAIDLGAESIVLEEKVDIEFTNLIYVEDINIFAADLLSYFYKNKINKLSITAITGTNGKTSTALILHKYLEYINESSLVIGTLGVHSKYFNEKLNNTTPNIFELYRIFQKAIKYEIKNIVMEVSSHSLKLLRVRGIVFDNIIFTNITTDHLDYHKTIEDYFYSKSRIFFNTKNDSLIILNKDDLYYQLLKEIYPRNVITYGKDINAKYCIKKVNHYDEYISFNVNNNYYVTKLFGEFNIYNISSVIALITEYGYSLDKFNEFLQELHNLEGRMNMFYFNKVKYVIDFAHTIDAVKNVLNTLGNNKTGRLITVIGCGGNRDKTKRPIMGKCVCELSDEVIFTSDNPRDEDQNAILYDITNTLEFNNFTIIPDRKNAIIKAVSIAKENDVVAILGKGHEKYQEVNGVFYPFKDEEVLKEVLEEIKE